MRQLVPGMSDKTDKATVFEFGARYIHFLKSFVGTEHDKVGFNNECILIKNCINTHILSQKINITYIDCPYDFNSKTMS